VRIPASLRGAGSSVVIVLLSASAVTLPTDAVERAVFEQNYDPLEALSRDIFDSNPFADRILIRPVVKVYVALLPEDGRDVIRRVSDNMKEPSLFFNNLLQGERQQNRDGCSSDALAQALAIANGPAGAARIAPAALRAARELWQG
jgi:ABC-type transporter lipoprotein component MlaA